MERIEGKVDSIRFFNEESNWGVIKVAWGGRNPLTDDEDAGYGEVVCVGNMPPLYEGQMVIIEGTKVEDEQWGDQIKIEQIETPVPKTVSGVSMYLATLVKGIGDKTALRIAEHFGDETFDVLERAPDRLKECAFLKPALRDDLVSSWRMNKARNSTMAWLMGAGLTEYMAMTIFSKYKDRTRGLLMENPYRLAWDVYGVGFKRADQVAAKTGFDMRSLERFAAAVHYAMSELANKGNVFALRVSVVTALIDLLPDVWLGDKQFEAALEMGVRDGYLIREAYGTENERLYLTRLHLAETETADMLRAIAEFPTAIGARWANDDPGVMILQPRGDGIILTEQQEKAVWASFFHPLSVITGGPGTGKTTLVQEICAQAQKMNVKFFLCAPTGRAAKRLKEATMQHAYTIHRALGAFPGAGEGGFTFLWNRDKQFTEELIIVDESSMIDISLIWHLLMAIRPGTHVVFVGDIDQLPSVGPGAVLSDIIESGAAYVTRLDTIHRQSESSMIVPNAHAVNRGEIPETDNNSDDFWWFEINDPDKSADQLVQLATDRIPNKFGFDAHDDVQVLAPMYKGMLGINSLNARLKAILNPTDDLQPCFSIGNPDHGGRVFHVDDKVIQTRNDYELEIVNGDIGWVTGVAEKRLYVTFNDDQEVEMTRKGARSLYHAYCISVHKSQGGEFPCVIMPVSTQHYIMLQRNLLYTGITRAKKVVVLVGTRKALSLAVRNDVGRFRYSGLRDRIKGEANAEE